MRVLATVAGWFTGSVSWYRMKRRWASPLVARLRAMRLVLYIGHPRGAEMQSKARQGRAAFLLLQPISLPLTQHKNGHLPLTATHQPSSYSAQLEGSPSTYSIIVMPLKMALLYDVFVINLTFFLHFLGLPIFKKILFWKYEICKNKNISKKYFTLKFHWVSFFLSKALESFFLKSSIYSAIFVVQDFFILWVAFSAQTWSWFWLK